MQKIKQAFIKQQYRTGVTSYVDFTKEVGLWESEKYVFEKYLQDTDKILDLGCGTGRTTFPIYKLGSQDIVGVDLTPEMIAKAKELNTYFNTAIDFRIGDATLLDFPDNRFNVVIFSFNGLMSIPEKTNRQKALSEIHRVLINDGLFIFTTHDREQEEQFFQFWKEEKQRWNSGSQNPLLHEFGDLIAHSKNEESEIFIHIPNQLEVKTLLKESGFSVIETFYRNEKFDESEAIKLKSGECRFWVANKTV